MKTKHKEGPWSYDSDNADSGGGGQWFAILGPDGENLLWRPYNATRELDREQEANAKVMAAAPNLLAALAEAERLYSSYALTASGGMEVGAWINATRDAITKATA